MLISRPEALIPVYMAAFQDSATGQWLVQSKGKSGTGPTLSAAIFHYYDITALDSQAIWDGKWVIFNAFRSGRESNFLTAYLMHRMLPTIAGWRCTKANDLFKLGNAHLPGVCGIGADIGEAINSFISKGLQVSTFLDAADVSVYSYDGFIVVRDSPTGSLGVGKSYNEALSSMIGVGHRFGLSFQFEYGEWAVTGQGGVYREYEDLWDCHDDLLALKTRIGWGFKPYVLQFAALPHICGYGETPALAVGDWESKLVKVPRHYALIPGFNLYTCGDQWVVLGGARLGVGPSLARALVAHAGANKC